MVLVVLGYEDGVNDKVVALLVVVLMVQLQQRQRQRLSGMDSP